MEVNQIPDVMVSVQDHPPSGDGLALTPLVNGKLIPTMYTGPPQVAYIDSCGRIRVASYHCSKNRFELKCEAIKATCNLYFPKVFWDLPGFCN